VCRHVNKIIDYSLNFGMNVSFSRRAQLHEVKHSYYMSKTSLRSRHSLSRQLHRKEFLSVQGDFTYGDSVSHLTLKRESSNIQMNGRAITQVVCRRLSTTVARARTQIRLCEICSGQSGPGADFHRVLRFPLPIHIPPIASHTSSSIIRGWYNRPVAGHDATPEMSEAQHKVL
jgi:hypothetical protein